MVPELAVIDDSDDIRDSLTGLLQEEGYRVTTFGSAADAWAWMESGGRPAAILLDLHMPGMNGVEFRRRQTHSPDVANIPVILLTGTAHLDEEPIGKSVTFAIAKPINVDLLLRTLNRLTGTDEQTAARSNASA